MIHLAAMTFMFKPWWTSARTTHEDILQGLAAVGFEGVEPFHRDFVEDPHLAGRYRRILGECNLRVPAVDVMCNLVYGNDRQKIEDRDELRRGLDICNTLGAGVAHVAGHKLREDVTPGDGRKMIAEGLVEAAELADGYGIVLAIEDFHPSPELICTAADCLEVIELSGGVVKCVFDTGNFAVVDESADEVFDLLAEHICHCHVKDFAGSPGAVGGVVACDLGEGMIPNAAVARRLVERGYDGWVALETMPRDHVDPVTAVKAEMPLLRSWFPR